MSRVPHEILDGDALYLGQAARLLPRSRQDRPVAPSTLYRWIRDGVRLPSGERLRLEAVCIAGRWATTRAALARFLARQTASYGGGDAQPVQSPATHRRRHDVAAKVLRERHHV